MSAHLTKFGNGHVIGVGPCHNRANTFVGSRPGEVDALPSKTVIFQDVQHFVRIPSRREGNAGRVSDHRLKYQTARAMPMGSANG